MPARGGQGRVEVAEYTTQPLVQLPARFGEFDAVRGAVQQPCPDRLLQLPDRTGQRRLGDQQLVAGGRERTPFRDRDERAQMPQLYLHTPQPKGPSAAMPSAHSQAATGISFADRGFLPWKSKDDRPGEDGDTA